MTGVVTAAAIAVAATTEPRGQPIHASWTALPLRDVADQLTRISGVAVVVDRRVDSTTRITYEANGQPFDAVACRIADHARADVAMLDAMVRIAPAAAAAMSEAAEGKSRAERRALPAAQRRVLDTTAAWTWPAGARPRDLVAAAAAGAGVTITGIEAIPHDHFPAGALPPLSLAARLDAILAHFDRRVSWTAGRDEGMPRGRIVPLEPAPADAVRHRPRAAPAGDHSPVPPAAAAAQVFTLRVEAPLDQLLATVATRLGLTLELDRASLLARGIAPEEIVRTKVENASREALLDAILKPLDVRWRIEGDTLTVWASARQ